MATSPVKQEKKQNKLAIKILKIFGLFVLMATITLGGIFAYLYTNQSTIKNVITTTLNQQLNTEVAVGNIDIDFFSKFPEVAVKFTRVKAKEALEISEQPLFLFKAIHVRFSIWDLLDQDYTIRKLSFGDGEVNLRVTQQGLPNYRFWKTTPDTAQTSTTIALEDIDIANTRFRYIDEKSAIRVLVFVDNLQVKGKFQNKNFTANAAGQAMLEDLTVRKEDYVNNIPIALAALLNVANGETKITATDVNANGLNMSATGAVTADGQVWKVKIPAAQLAELNTLVPKKWRLDLAKLNANAWAQTAAIITINPTVTQVDIDANLTAGQLKQPDFNLALTNISGAVHYQYYAEGETSTSQLQAKALKAKTKTGELSAHVELLDFSAPKIKAKGQFSLGADELLASARPGLASAAGGTVHGQFTYKNNSKSWDDFKANAFASHQLNGDITVENGFLTLANSNIELKQVSADLHIKNKDLEIERLFAAEGNSEFLIDGTMHNAIYVGQNRPVPSLNIRLQSQRIDLDRIMQWRLPKLSAGSASSNSYTMNYRVFLDVDQFNLIRFVGLNLTGEIWNEGLKIKGKNMSCQALDGTVNGNFAWNPTENGYRFWTNTNLQKLNIHKLFNGFKNFGQEWLLAENIYGIGSANLESSMTFDKNMALIPSSLKLVTDFSIDNGRLKGYKPLLSLNSIVDEAELNDVHFEHLENEIAIENQVINIPKMEIKSSAINLSLLGRHSFDQQIDYSIRLAMQDVISKKKKTKQTDLDDWIVEVEAQDKLHIWVHVGCHVDNPCLSLDREMIKKGVKQEWQKQGEDIKNIFKPTSPKEKPKDPTKGEVMFEWNEEEPDTNRNNM